MDNDGNGHEKVIKMTQIRDNWRFLGEFINKDLK